jgi:hypothetical protein
VRGGDPMAGHCAAPGEAMLAVRTVLCVERRHAPCTAGRDVLPLSRQAIGAAPGSCPDAALSRSTCLALRGSQAAVGPPFLALCCVACTAPMGGGVGADRPRFGVAPRRSRCRSRSRGRSAHDRVSCSRYPSPLLPIPPAARHRPVVVTETAHDPREQRHCHCWPRVLPCAARPRCHRSYVVRDPDPDARGSRALAVLRVLACCRMGASRRPLALLCPRSRLSPGPSRSALRGLCRCPPASPRYAPIGHPIG